MKRDGLALAVLAALMAVPATAQERFGEYRSDCNGREIKIWGTDGDLQLRRGDEGLRGARVRAGNEITWFCDGERREFFCQQSNRANYVELEWLRTGPVTFYCQRR